VRTHITMIHSIQPCHYNNKLTCINYKPEKISSKRRKTHPLFINTNKYTTTTLDSTFRYSFNSSKNNNVDLKYHMLSLNVFFFCNNMSNRGRRWGFFLFFLHQKKEKKVVFSNVEKNIFFIFFKTSFEF
jgi:hypothetical protein